MDAALMPVAEDLAENLAEEFADLPTETVVGFLDACGDDYHNDDARLLREAAQASLAMVRAKSMTWVSARG